jgi:hypothetical protein
VRETPKATATKPPSKGVGGQVNDLGYGENAVDATMDDPQPSSYEAARGLRSGFRDLIGVGSRVITSTA